jgi:UDP-glucose 4-epimerase
MDRAIVTGGAGFIGSHLVDRLIDLGLEVLVLDDLSSGMAKNVNCAAELQKLDLNDNWGVKQCVSLFDPDVVFHLAAQANLTRSVHEPLDDACNNILGSISLFEACRETGVETLVYASTAGGIYAGALYEEGDSFCEQTPERPLSPYGLSKLAVEKYLQSFYYRFFRHVTLRLPNVYGPRRNPDSGAGVVSIFCHNILSGKPCYLYGDGKLVRDYVYVSDVVDAFCLAAEESYTKGRSLYNIGSGVPVSVNDIADHLCDYAREQGYEPTFVNEEARSGEGEFIQIDSEKFRETSGWAPVIRLREGIRSTFDWVRSNYYDNN